MRKMCESGTNWSIRCSLQDAFLVQTNVESVKKGSRNGEISGDLSTLAESFAVSFT